MRKHTNHLRPFAEARIDYLWCVRARLLDRSESAWLEFVAGYFAVDDFFRSAKSETVTASASANSLRGFRPSSSNVNKGEPFNDSPPQTAD
ncbi:MAG TPA: hypothetical protein VEK11_24465, partial [Thermoanaerobaculia bacterium]|nr:hypothetical protein [Thermoanaerobaculia bacterium]